jgi:hypothetical protein
MKLESTEVINKPLEDVYTLVRDELEKLVPYLPNVNKIEVVDKSQTDNKVHIVNNWYAMADMPKLLSKFLKPEIFSWKDIADWNNETHSVDYSLESFLANDLFDAKGTNTFTALGDDKTELKISCEVSIYPEKIPGVPRLIAGKVKPMVESLIEKILAPNLTSLGTGLNKYFSENEA